MRNDEKTNIHYLSCENTDLGTSEFPYSVSTGRMADNSSIATCTELGMEWELNDGTFLHTWNRTS